MVLCYPPNKEIKESKFIFCLKVEEMETKNIQLKHLLRNVFNGSV